MNKWNEKAVEIEIVYQLRYNLEGIVCKFNQSGYPLREGGRVKTIIPFADNQYSPPDLYYAFCGMDYWIEVKHPSKIKSWYRQYNDGVLEDKFILKEQRTKNKRLTDYRQFLFLRDVRKEGVCAGYVSSWDQVDFMIRNNPKDLYWGGN